MKKFVLLMLALWATVSWAQPVRPAGPLTPMEHLWYKVSGNPNAEIRPMVLGPSNHGNASFYVNPDGSIGAKAKTLYTPGRGAPIVVDVASKVSKPSVVAAIGRYLAKGGFATPIMVGFAVAEVAALFGYSTEIDRGDVRFMKSDLVENWRYSCWDGAPTTDGMNCIATMQAVQRTVPGYSNCEITYSGWGGGPAYFQGVPYAPNMLTTRTGCPNNSGPASRVKLSESSVKSQVSHQQFLDNIAEQSGWPPSSALARSLDDALKSGESVQTENPILSGPASSPGTPTIKSVNTTNNTTTTTNNTNNYKYDGPNIKVTNVTSVTVTNNTTNETVSEETTEQEEEPEPDDSAQDTPLPDLPKLYERQYPDGLTGVWNDKKAELLETPLLQLTTNLMPTIATTGGYPYWPIPVVIGPWNFGTFDASPASYVWDFLKVCVILGALFLARALIFGG